MLQLLVADRDSGEHNSRCVITYITINEQGSVADLLNAYQAQTGRHGLTVHYRGNLLRDDAALWGLISDLQESSPRFTITSNGVVQVNVVVSSGQTFTLDSQSSDTVLELRQRIEHKANLRKQRLSFQGKLLLDEHLTVDSCGLYSGCTVHLTDAPVGSMNLYIRDSNGGTILLLDLELYHTIDDVKCLIQDEHDIAPDKYRLSAGSSWLRLNQGTLQQHGIEDSAQLCMVQPTQANTSNTSTNNGAPVRLRNVTALTGLQHKALAYMNSAPVWREVSAGLNAEGSCQNELCAAFGTGKLVIAQQHMTAFELGLTPCCCPVCSTEMCVLALGVRECAWRYDGVKHDGTQHSSEWSVLRGEDQYYRFKQLEPQLRDKWSRLVVTVRPADAPERSCAVCSFDCSDSNSAHEVCEDALADYAQQQAMQA
jgi:Ubiquitin family